KILQFTLTLGQRQVVSTFIDRIECNRAIGPQRGESPTLMGRSFFSRYEHAMKAFRQACTALRTNLAFNLLRTGQYDLDSLDICAAYLNPLPSPAAARSRIRSPHRTPTDIGPAARCQIQTRRPA